MSSVYIKFLIFAHKITGRGLLVIVLQKVLHNETKLYANKDTCVTCVYTKLTIQFKLTNLDSQKKAQDNEDRITMEPWL